MELHKLPVYPNTQQGNNRTLKSPLNLQQYRGVPLERASKLYVDDFGRVVLPFLKEVEHTQSFSMPYEKAQPFPKACEQAQPFATAGEQAVVLRA